MLLRINGRKKYRRRAKGPRKDQIPNRKGIELRPKSVENRRFFGDWEGDTVAGAKASKGRIVTLVERKSLFTVIAKMETGKPQCLNDALVARLEKHPDLPLRTITVDNGVEFLRHEELSKQLHTSIFFAKPYCSWQRGLNENTNGLIRQYFPKGVNFQLVGEEHIARVEHLLNNRPRKKLGYRTPAEVMAKLPKSRVVPLLI